MRNLIWSRKAVPLPGSLPRCRFVLVGLSPAIALVWLVGIGAGFAQLLNYATTPGDKGTASISWPANALLRPDPTRPNLVLAIHPQCPCTRATLEALDQVLARCPGRVTVHVLFYRPRGFPENWEKTDLWDRAVAMPGVRVLPDDDGVLAEQFGLATSGHVVLFASAGQRLFSGGITDTRGHAGASIGSEAIVTLLNTDAAAPRETPVFGCPLFHPPSPPSGGL